MKSSFERFYELADGLSKMLAADAKSAEGQVGDLKYEQECGRQTIAMMGELTALVANAMPKAPVS